MSIRPSPGARMLIALVRMYQAVPKGATPRCRFAPSCSEYAAQALRLHGAWRGLGLAVRRLARCHPFNPGGIDRVPEPRQRQAAREGVTA